MKLIDMNHARVFSALARKDMRLFFQKLKDALIDGTGHILPMIVIYGYFFPLLGIDEKAIAPLFCGVITLMFFGVGFSHAMRMVFDIQFNRFIDYQIMLPAPKKWVMASYIANLMVEGTMTILPIGAVGTILLGDKFSFAHTNWLQFACIFVLALFFFATFFFACAFFFSFSWFMDNMWPRVLAPMLILSSSLVVWQHVYAFSPVSAIIFLLNPMTYATEGLRTTLLDSQHYLPFWACATGLIVFSVLNIYLLDRGMKRRLDPV